MSYQVGDRVWIRLPFQDGQLKQGTIYAICSERRWPYHVMPDGKTEVGVAYSQRELASADLSLDQVVPTCIPQKECEIFASLMGFVGGTE